MTLYCIDLLCHFGRLQGKGLPAGTRAASSDLDRLQGIGLPPGTQAASGDSDRLQGLAPPFKRDLGRIQAL